MTSKEIKETVSIVDLLSRMGFEPVKIHGQEYKYFSPLRNETKPSFYVNENLSVWYDQGLGKGGNVIDFGLAYWKLSFPETLEKIAQVSGQGLPGASYNRQERKRSAVKIPNYKVEDIKELGTNTAITDYLQTRAIWQVAQGRLKEVYYYVEDQKKQRKYFFAAGWQNEQGAWEVRNLHFQASLGHKAVSFIPGSNECLSLFEGYMDYLSWLTENPEATDSVIVLNSVNLLPIGIKKAQEFSEVSVYFDRDTAGHTATLELIEAIPLAIDRSAIYDGHNDYNDYLRATNVAQANTITR
jgi:DNA primase